MPLFTDQTGRTISLPAPPTRIVSLVPSITELLHHFNLENEVCGITKFCVHPARWFHTKTRIGGTKDLNLPLIKSLAPDLIIASKEENVREQVAALWDKYPVYVSDVANLESACGMVAALGSMTGKSTEADTLADRIENDFNSLPRITEKLPVAYLIWRNPYMTVGGDTFINDMLGRAGFRNVFEHHVRYPVVTPDDLRLSGCRVVLLSSEPYPFAEKHAAELKTQLPGVVVVLADGELFSWYGSRMLQAPEYYRKLNLEIQAMFV